MSETKFTEGPWIADVRGGCCAVYPKSEIDDWYSGMHSQDDRNIYYSSAQAQYNGHHWEMSKEHIANAHLIAAAPEMYETLNKCKRVLSQTYAVADAPCGHLSPEKELMNEIYLLLAKARGEHE